MRVALRRPGSAIPQHHLAAAVFPFRDRPFEAAIFQRMVLDADREAFFRRVETRPARHRPAFQKAIELQAEIEVKPPRPMLLDDVKSSR